MPDEIVLVSDVIVPEIWLPYAIQRSTELSVFHQAGIIEQSPEFANLVDAERGTQAQMPFWNDLTGKSEVIAVDGSPVTTKKITSAQDMAQIHNLASAWAVHDLAGAMAGSDPAQAIANLVGGFWARDTQSRLLATLQGVFDAASMSGNVAEIHHTTGGAGSATTANQFNAETFIDAAQLMGDHKEVLTAIAIHSAVHASIEKAGLIDTIPDDQGRPIQYFRGLRIVIDDGMPREVIDGDAVYTSYLFGRGAVAQGVGSKNAREMGMSPESTWQLEYGRNAKSHISEMINRRRYILHPRGVKWTAASLAIPSGATEAELATSTNWTRVYASKNIRMVQFKHNIS